MRRRQYIALTVGGATASLAGCSGSGEELEQADSGDTGGSGGSSGGSGGETSRETETNTESGPEEVTATVGDLVEGEQMSLVVENFERGVDFGEFDEPESGNEFALASIALKNTTDEYAAVSNLLQTRIRDDEDYQYDQTIVGDTAATFNDGQFAPGELERGGIPFEIPEDASGLTLVFDFDASLFGGVDRATIDLESEAGQVHQLEQNLQIDTYDVGEAISYGDVQVTLNEMRTESSLSQFAEPEAGNEYAIVDISITNETGEEQRFSTMLQMMLKDGAGYTYQEKLTAMSELDRAFDEGTPLSDGETRRGELAYEVEEGLNPLYWVFEFELFASGNKTFWQIR